MFVELDTRQGDGLTVTLEWDRDTEHTQIVVHDMRSDGLIAFVVPPASAADAFSPPVQVRAMICRAAPRRARVDAAVAAYAQWRSERAVRAAYRVSSAAGAFGEPPAFETYQPALDREERAIGRSCTPLASADAGRTLIGVEAGDQNEASARDDRRSREAITDGRGLLLWLSFLVRR